MVCGVDRDFADGWASGGNGLMAGYADLGRGQADRLDRGGRLVAEHASDIIFAMLLVAERNGLHNGLSGILSSLSATR